MSQNELSYWVNADDNMYRLQGSVVSYRPYTSGDWFTCDFDEEFLMQVIDRKGFKRSDEGGVLCDVNDSFNEE